MRRVLIRYAILLLIFVTLTTRSHGVNVSGITRAQLPAASVALLTNTSVCELAGAFSEVNRVERARYFSNQCAKVGSQAVARMPVVFVHEEGVISSGSEYFASALRTALEFNDEVVMLLKEGAKISPVIELYLDPRITVHRFNASDPEDPLGADAFNFAQVYEHMSSNAYRYELVSFQRYFVLRSWMAIENVSTLMYLDSDVLLFREAKAEARCFAGCAVVVCEHAKSASAHTSMWTKRGIDAFCDFLSKSYTDQKLLNGIRQQWKNYQENFRKRNEKIAGGLCDMSLLKWWINDHRRNVAVCDNCQTSDTGGLYDHTKGFHLEKFFVDEYKLPAVAHKGTVLPLKTLHFQGRTKTLLQTCPIQEQFVVFTNIGALREFDYIPLIRARAVHQARMRLVLINHFYPGHANSNWAAKWVPTVIEQSLLKNLSVELVQYDIRRESSRHSAVLSKWVNASVSPYEENDKFSTLRFVSLAHFAKQQSQHALFLHHDLDIVDLTNIFESIPELTWHAGSYFAVWNSDLLQGFADYVSRFYNTSDREKATIISTYGQEINGKLLDNLANVTRSWWTLPRTALRNWNDMFLFKAWIATDKPRKFGDILCDREHCSYRDSRTSLHVLHAAMPYLMELVHVDAKKSTCLWADGVWTNASNGFLARRGDVPIASIHFQGGSKRILCICLCAHLAAMERALAPCCA